jgi:hypothetical protein
MKKQYINPEARLFVIVDVTDPDFEKVVNCTFDTKEGAKKLMESWKREFPKAKVKLFREVKLSRLLEKWQNEK